MSKQTINLGTAANNGNDGDDARTAFSKVNDNFTEVYALAGGAQPVNAKLTALASAVWAANQLQYQTGAGTVANTPLTVAARALLDDPDSPAMRVTLGLGGQILQALQALTMTANGVPYMASASTMAVQPSSAFGRGLLNLAGEAAGRAAFGALGVGSYGLGTSNGPTTTIAALDTLVENMFVSTSEGGSWGSGAAGSYPMGFNITRSPSVKAQFAIAYGTKAAGGGAYYRNTSGSGVWASWAKLLESGDYGIGAASVLETSATAWQGNKFTGWAAAAPDSPSGQVAVGLDMGYNVERRFQIGITTSNNMYFRYTTDASGQANWKKVIVEGDAGIGLSSSAGLPGNTLLVAQPSGFWGGTSQGTAGMPTDTSNNGTGIWTASYTGSAFHFAIATVSRKFHFGYSAGNGTAVQASEVFHQNNSAALPLTTHLAPSTDNNRQLGTSGVRWSVVYSATGAINTSDAREKTPVSKLSASETTAAKELSREIGTYKWLAAIKEKGDGARNHIGLTVQRAIEIMESHGLEPFSYGFICYDEWEDEYEEHEATYETTTDEDGEESQREVTPYQKVKIRDKGNRYSFRYDELTLFIAAGIESRLSELEQRM